MAVLDIVAQNPQPQCRERAAPHPTDLEHRLRAPYSSSAPGPAADTARITSATAAGWLR